MLGLIRIFLRPDGVLLRKSLLLVGEDLVGLRLSLRSCGADRLPGDSNDSDRQRQGQCGSGGDGKCVAADELLEAGQMGGREGPHPLDRKIRVGGLWPRAWRRGPPVWGPLRAVE